MASVTGYTAARMQEIEDQAIVDGSIVGDNLILERHNGGTINAGNVRGAAGPTGPPGAVGGSVGTVDNRVVRADGTGGTTAQGSLVTIDDAGRVTAPLMTVTTAPSVDTDVVNKLYSDQKGRGVLDSVSYSTQESLTLSAWKTLNSALSITITPVVGRRYKFEAHVPIIGDPAICGALAVFKSTDLTNAIARGDNGTTQTGWPSSIFVNKIVAIPSGWDVSTQFILRMFVNGYVDTGSHLNPATFSITDVGPV